MEYKILLNGGMDCRETFFSGQAFRWKEENDGFSGIVGGYTAHVHMQQENLVIQSDAPQNFWYNYFAAELDYKKLKEIFCKDDRLAPCVNYAKGIRVLHQPFFETVCSFIISQNNNIPRITGIVERLCQYFGQKLSNGQYAFPTASDLAAQTVESLSPLRAGFRAKYIIDAATKINSGEITEEKLQKLSTQAARAELIKIYGVGTKVADCTLLYALGRSEVIPMDVHMKRAMENMFSTGLCAEALPFGGIAQQYIFHYTRNNEQSTK